MDSTQDLNLREVATGLASLLQPSITSKRSIYLGLCWSIPSSRLDLGLLFEGLGFRV